MMASVDVSALPAPTSSSSVTATLACGRTRCAPRPAARYPGRVGCWGAGGLPGGARSSMRPRCMTTSCTGALGLPGRGRVYSNSTSGADLGGEEVVQDAAPDGDVQAEVGCRRSAAWGARPCRWRWSAGACRRSKSRGYSFGAAFRVGQAGFEEGGDALSDLERGRPVQRASLIPCACRGARG